MKNSILVFLLAIACVSCSKDDAQQTRICETPLTCTDEDCLYTIDNSAGETTYLSCFDRWGIIAPHPEFGGQNIWLIVDEWNEKYETEGRSIIFCGYVRENTVPLQFPDPSVGEVRQIRLAGVALAEEF